MPLQPLEEVFEVLHLLLLALELLLSVHGFGSSPLAQLLVLLLQFGVVLVQVVLHQDVPLDPSVELVHFPLLGPHDLILLVDLLEALEELELEESIVDVLLVDALLLPLPAGHWEVRVKSEAVPGLNGAVRVDCWLWSPQVAGNHQLAHLSIAEISRLVHSETRIRIIHPAHGHALLGDNIQLFLNVFIAGHYLVQLLFIDASTKHALLVAIWALLARQLLEHQLHLATHLVDVLLLVHLDLRLEQLVLVLDVVVLGGIDDLAGGQFYYELVDLGPLVLRELEAVVPSQLGNVRVMVHYRYLLQLVFEVGAFPLELVVVLLKNSDKLLEIVNLLSVHQSHLFAVDSVIIRH